MKTQAARLLEKPIRSFERIGATSKGPGKESESARGRRLTAALARDDEQVFSADNRLTYSIVALDGTGVLLEAARAAKAVVDDKLMRKYAGPPQWSAPPANNDHEATSAPSAPAAAAAASSSASSGDVLARRRLSTTVAPLPPSNPQEPRREHRERNPPQGHACSFKELVMKHEGRSYAEVVATDDDFVREMSKVLEAKLPDDILARYNGRGPPASTPSNEPGTRPREQGAPGSRGGDAGGRSGGDAHHAASGGDAGGVLAREPPPESNAMLWRLLWATDACAHLPGQLLHSLRAIVERRCLQSAGTSDLAAAAATSVRRTGGSMGVVQGGVESTCSHKGTLVEMSGGGAPATRQKALGARVRSLSHAPSAVQSTEEGGGGGGGGGGAVGRLPSTSDPPPPPARLSRTSTIGSTRRSSRAVSKFRAVAKQVLRIIPWDAKYKSVACPPDETTTVEDVILTPELFNGDGGAQGGHGAHGETAFLLCALKGDELHRVVMLFLVEHYARKARAAAVREDAGDAPPPSPGAAAAAAVAERTGQVGSPPGEASAPGDGGGASPSAAATVERRRAAEIPPAEQLLKLVNATYEGPQYHGETALHFAVMHRDELMVRTLVEAGADVDAHADGLFFYERASTYFGGRAVGLAAHLGELRILDYLVEKGADVHFLDMGCLATFEVRKAGSREWHDWQTALDAWMHETPADVQRDVRSSQSWKGKGSVTRDKSRLTPVAEGQRSVHSLACFVSQKQPFCSVGTTILHVCVAHDQPDVFRHLVEAHGAQMHLRNSWEQTPLAIAATQGSVRVFEAALDCCGETLWEFGAIKCIQLPLLEIETQLEGSNDGKASVLRTLVRNKRYDHLSLRTMHQLINDKWRRFGWRVFWLQAIAFLTALLLLCAHVDCSTGAAECNRLYHAFLVSASVLLVLSLPPPRWPPWQQPQEGAPPTKLSRLSVRRVVAVLFSLRAFFALLIVSTILHPAALGTLLVRSTLVCSDDGDAAATLDIVVIKDEGVCTTGLLSANVVLAMAAIVGWANFVSLCAARSKRFGPFVNIMLHMTLNDVSRFVVFALCTLVAFSTATIALSRTYTYANNGTSVVVAEYTDTYGGSVGFFELLRLLLRAPFDDFAYLEEQAAEAHPLPYLSKALLVTYEVAMCLVLVNMLIALMNTTYQRRRKRAAEEWRGQFAELVLWLESTWLGELLRPAQLLTMEADDASGARADMDGDDIDGQRPRRVRAAPNAAYGYRWYHTREVTKPLSAEKVARFSMESGKDADSLLTPVRTWWYRIEIEQSLEAATGGDPALYSGGGCTHGGQHEGHSSSSRSHRTRRRSRYRQAPNVSEDDEDEE